MFNQEVKKLQNYNQEVQKFFIDKLLDTDFKSINDILNYYKHDFCYWIAWPRKASDKLFITGMNQVCKGFGNKIYNYSFYGAVRAFGGASCGVEEKLLGDFFGLGV